MAQLSSEGDYAGKEAGYFVHARPEMLRHVPRNAGRVLDVGCGAGAFGEALKRRGHARVDGVEIVPAKAAEARTRLDQVWRGAFDRALDLPTGIYDCVVFNDVLEHLMYPREALVYARQLLTHGGCVVASIPNIRHFPTVWKLVLRGRWDCAEAGTLDRTHLRFFTRATILDLFQRAGYEVTTMEGINRYAVNSQDEHCLWRYLKVLQLVFPKRFCDMSYLQFAVVARMQKG